MNILNTRKLSVKRQSINRLIGTATAMLMLFTINMLDFGKKCKSIENDVLRLHIIANSDSASDQELKLKIRDELLTKGEEIFNGSVTKENAAQKLSSKFTFLQETAQKVIDENGKDYKATIKLSKEYFNTREYEEFTLPAGNYLSLTVDLGESKGHNWWCVMFPPLCLPAAQNNQKEIYDAVLSESQRKLIEGKSKYKIEFKIVEWYNELMRLKKDKK